MIPTRSSLRLIIALFVMASFTSCSKKDDAPPPPTKAELLAHKWFFSKWEDPSDGTFRLADSCTEQTFFDFKTDNTFLSQEFDYDSGNVCTHGLVDISTYILTENDTKIMVTNSMGGQSTFIINSLSETVLALKFEGGTIYTFNR
ncbi:lipocalin family protein [Aequorivita todarodis]|uniref:lipocalin family protein n=1 Tax=Aequorivita todarodis TaxID=2036821 RepID=UPI00234FEE29|nr:lipocalin family protein [Aequorivita todarodis]MDC8001130.1 lipocalin family protein [Aequorivita todarodis]